MSRSIQQLPNNSGTTSVTEVYSATGFNAGDPVYFQNGDYKSPANLTAPSSVSFSFPESAAIDPYGAGGIISPAFTFAQMQTGIGGGTSRKFASVLTNGNIVQVWSNNYVTGTNPNCPYFRVIDSSGTVVVNPTVISTVYIQSTTSSVVSVAALTGGGFVVAWNNQSGGTTFTVNYAIYSNTGSVTYAVVQDTSFSLGTSAQPIEVIGLANGGFAIAAKNNSGVIFLRAYNSIGTGAYTTQNTGITAGYTNNSFALAARSDNSVFVCDTLNTTTYKYALYNSSGSAVVAATNFSSTGSLQQPIGGTDASVLADGTTIVIAYYSQTLAGQTSYPAIRLLPTGNTLGSEIISIPTANVYYDFGYAGSYIGVLCLSSNNFILVFGDGFGNMQYAFYNSSGVCVSGSNTAGAVPQLITGGFAGASTKITLTESSGFVYVYFTSAQYNQKPVQQMFCKISATTYAIVPTVSFATPSAYSFSGQPTGALITSTVNPNSASFYSTTSLSAVSSSTVSAVNTPTVINSAATDSIASCTLTNGNFVVVYRLNASPWTVYASIYSPNGALVTTATVGAGYATTNTFFCVKVAALSGGGFVVAWLSPTATTANFTVYSSAYSASATGTVTIDSFGANYNFDITGLSENKFAFVFRNSAIGYGQINVYDSSCTILQAIPLSVLFSYGFAIAGNSYGAFAVVGFYGAGSATYGRTYIPTGTNTWSNAVTGVNMNCPVFVYNPQLCATESGTYVFTGSGSSYPLVTMITDSGTPTPYYSGQSSSWPIGSGNGPTSYSMVGVGTTGNGQLVYVISYSGTNLGIANLPPSLTYSNGQPLPYSTNASTYNLALMFSPVNQFTNSTAVAEVNALPRVTPGVGNRAIITFRGASNYPSFLIVNGTNNSVAYSVVANTTVSSLVAIAPTPQTTTNINGVFAGVAITSATAGSTGQLSINGQALLGSSYTSTAAGAFDSTGNAVSGVKGTFNGRSVNLQGNS